MRILLSAYACQPNAGTEPGFGWNWAVQLAQQGNEVCCLTSVRNRALIEQQLRQEPIAGLQFVHVAVPRWVEHLRAANHYRFVYVHYYFWQKAAYRVAKKLPQSQSFDLVHHVTYGSLQMGSRLWKLGIPFVFGPAGGGQTPPSMLMKYFGSSGYKERLRALFSFLLVKGFGAHKMLRSAQLVLITNQETHALAARHGASHLQFELDTALPASFYPAERPLRSSDGPVKALWVGTMHPRKGVEMLLDIFAEMPDHVSLTLVGGGSQEANVRAKISRLGLEQQVSCAGRVPYGEVKDFYRTHDIFVFCSLRDSFGSQLLEAMAYGLPVVALDHQGVRTFVPDNASIKVSITDAETTVRTFRSSLLELAADPEKRDRMGRNGYEYALENQWSHKVEKIQEVYTSLVNRVLQK